MSEPDSTSLVMAFTAEQAARLTGISPGQLVAWDAEGFFAPSLGAPQRGVAHARIYTFRDLAALRVINALRNNHRCSMAHLRDVKRKLTELGEREWLSTTLYVLNKRVIFDNPTTGTREEIVSGQGVVPIPLASVTGDLRRDVRLLQQRDGADIGKIERRRGIAGSRPVIAGTRIPIEALQSLRNAGRSIEDILDDYPSLARQDVERAVDESEAA